MGFPVAPSMRAWILRCLVVTSVITGLACDRDSDAGGDAQEAPAVTAGTPSPEESEAALAIVELGIAATGINLVASDVGIRTARASAADYCRSEAPGELQPHRAKLEAAADPEVRQHAAAALQELQAALQLCTEGAASGTVRTALDRYRESFARLQQRIDRLGGGS